MEYNVNKDSSLLSCFIITAARIDLQFRSTALLQERSEKELRNLKKKHAEKVLEMENRTKIDLENLEKMHEQELELLKNGDCVVNIFSVRIYERIVY